MSKEDIEKATPLDAVPEPKQTDEKPDEPNDSKPAEGDAVSADVSDESGDSIENA
jgi:hypothetical protein